MHDRSLCFLSKAERRQVRNWNRKLQAEGLDMRQAGAHKAHNREAVASRDEWTAKGKAPKRSHVAYGKMRAKR